MVKKNGNKLNPEPEDNLLYFFKIISHGLADEHLKIPQKFEKYLSKEVTARVILKGPSGKKWKVKLCKKTNGIHLEDGWKQFMKDHSLGDNEFLLFAYNGKSCFKVQIFDKNRCERVHVSDDQNQNQDHAFSEKKMKQGKKLVEKAHNYSPDTSNKIRETTESSTYEFPHFEVPLTISSAQKGILAIPTAFGRAHLPETRTEFIIQNAQEEAWPVSCLHNGIRYCFSKGWREFACGNNLKVGDCCIFELIQECKMQVYVFSAKKDI